jgi:hypothetical protein
LEEEEEKEEEYFKEKNRTIINYNKDVGIITITEKFKITLLPPHQNEDKNTDIRTANIFL